MTKKIIIFVLSLFLINSVLALGVSPASYETDFKPGLKQEFAFVFDLPGKSEVYVSGDLADYVSLDKSVIYGKEKVIASLVFPESMSKYGVNRIRVGARQVAESQTGVGIVADAGGIIKVNVPYPGRHLETEFYVSNSDIGQESKIYFKIYNNGDEDYDINPFVSIYNDKKEIEKIDFDKYMLSPGAFVEYRKDIKLSEAGDYTAKLSFDDFSNETKFNVGRMYVEINNAPKKVEEDKINRFNISVKSFSNNLIKDVYADVYVLNTNLSFSTPSIDLGSGDSMLIGFIDSREIGKGRFKANITVFYGNLSNSKVVSFRVGDADYAVYLGVIIVIIVVVFIFLKIKKRKIVGKKRKLK